MARAADLRGAGGKGNGRPTKYVRYGDRKPTSVKELALANQKQFRRVTGRGGSRGRMSSRFGATRVAPAHGWSNGQLPGKEVWLLVEWPVEEAELTKYYLCDLPKTLSRKRLVASARGRWRVEQDDQQSKEELGLNHFEGPGCTGWHHHVTLVMMAHVFLRLEQQHRSSKRTVDAAANTA